MKNILKYLKKNLKTKTDTSDYINGIENFQINIIHFLKED